MSDVAIYPTNSRRHHAELVYKGIENLENINKNPFEIIQHEAEIVRKQFAMFRKIQNQYASIYSASNFLKDYTSQLADFKYLSNSLKIYQEEQKAIFENFSKIAFPKIPKIEINNDYKVFVESIKYNNQNLKKVFSTLSVPEIPNLKLYIENYEALLEEINSSDKNSYLNEDVKKVINVIEENAEIIENEANPTLKINLILNYTMVILAILNLIFQASTYHSGKKSSDRIERLLTQNSHLMQEQLELQENELKHNAENNELLKTLNISMENVTVLLREIKELNFEEIKAGKIPTSQPAAAPRNDDSEGDADN